jgi:DNA-binding response OmpR family regulator
MSDIEWLEKWFNIWASDYIVKPFRLKELEIRIYKWFKLYFYSDKSNNCEFLEYNWLKYHLDENLFYYNEKKLILTKWNKYLLWIFISNKEKKLTERFLIEKIRGDIWFVVERNLRIVILRLKNNLKDYWIDWWIENIRWEGYIFKK